MLSVSRALFVADDDQVLDSHIHPQFTRTEPQKSGTTHDSGFYGMASFFIPSLTTSVYRSLFVGM